MNLGMVRNGFRHPLKALKYLLFQVYPPEGDEFFTQEMMRYLLRMDHLYRLVDDVPGHIVEFGVGPGTNAVLFGNLMHIYSDDYVRHYYGFDTFDGYPEEDLENSPHLNSDAWTNIQIDTVRNTLDAYDVNDVTTLIKGDLKTEFPAFVETEMHKRKSPGTFVISLLYVDCNSYDATKTGIEAALEYMAPGGLIACDQLRQGGEISALKEVCTEHGYSFRREESPTAWSAYAVIE